MVVDVDAFGVDIDAHVDVQELIFFITSALVTQ